MLHKFAKWLVVCALIISVGGHWAVLQSVAWVGMAVNYSKNSSVSEALSKTFDGKHPCQLCKLVKKGKKAEGAQEIKTELKKVDFFSAAFSPFYFTPPPVLAISYSENFFLHQEAPPTPPPLSA